MSKKLALIVDADLIAYRSAAVCEERSIQVKHLKSQRTRNFSTRTEFKDFLKAKYFKYLADDYEIVDIQEPQPVSHALSVVKGQLEKFREKFKPDIFHVVLSGSGNFREDLPLPKKYKSNRKDMIKPLLLSECKRYLKDKYQADVVNGCEADDAIIYYGKEYLDLGYDVVISTIDKDSRAYSGLNVWDFTDFESEPELINSLGFLKETDQGVKGSGFMYYCFQMLMGDPTDFYKPFEYFNMKYGEKSIFRYLNDCESESEALCRVIKKYKEFLPDKFSYVDWKGETHKDVDYIYWLSLYHKCVRMKETREDNLDFIRFAKKYGVNLNDK
ncbi:MAG: hypothetical protein ACRDBG_04425 [Waterburya sp.]